MKTTLSTSDIAHALKSDENANWSWNGARALAEYLEEYEESTGEELELDVVAIRCDFSQYDSLESWAEDYFGGLERMNEEIGIFGNSDELDNKIREYIQDNGTLIEFEGGIIVSSF
jgi:hypothetical protein